ncbi:hypothetical protein [Paraburkholderia panacisoli]|uniref:hypothetical protein n=1 Tax=Paraburkholderia panacisoli TaxID=2603818 RepID=UPI00165F9A5B|nr:hypothetical protein [Paraburkholderia panacisoli]
MTVPWSTARSRCDAYSGASASRTTGASALSHQLEIDRPAVRTALLRHRRQRLRAQDRLLDRRCTRMTLDADLRPDVTQQPAVGGRPKHAAGNRPDFRDQAIHQARVVAREIPVGCRDAVHDREQLRIAPFNPGSAHRQFLVIRQKRSPCRGLRAGGFDAFTGRADWRRGFTRRRCALSRTGTPSASSVRLKRQCRPAPSRRAL